MHKRWCLECLDEEGFVGGARTSVFPSPFEDFSPVKASGSLQFQQLHIKYKSGVGRNDTRVSRGPISHVWGAGDLRPLTQTHLKLGRNIIEQANTSEYTQHSIRLHYLCNSFLPALDDFLSADLEFKGLVSVSWRVKLLSILQHPCI